MMMVFMLVTTTSSLCFIPLGTQACFGGSRGLVVVGMGVRVRVSMGMGAASAGVGVSVCMRVRMCFTGRSRTNVPFRRVGGLIRRLLVFMVVFLLFFIGVVCTAVVFGCDAVSRQHQCDRPVWNGT